MHLQSIELLHEQHDLLQHHKSMKVICSYNQITSMPINWLPTSPVPHAVPRQQCSMKAGYPVLQAVHWHR